MDVAPVEEKPTKFDSEEEIFQDLLQAAERKIEILSKEDLAPKEINVAQPERQHLPELKNMEEYEDWLMEAKPLAMMEKRFKRGEETFVGQKIKVKELFKDVSTADGRLKKCSHVMALGSAGTGKTTLLRRIAHKGGGGVLDGRVILVPDFRALAANERILPAEVLLGDLYPCWDEEKMEQRYQWLIDHSDQLAFIVDSIDTMPFDLENERERSGYRTPAKVDVIAHNLLAKDLFPDSRIISSSREYKVRNLHPSVRPDRCVLLDGLTRDSVEDLIDAYLGEERGAEVKEHIDNECPDVWPLLSVPVFLTFSIICFVVGGFRPKTMSGILVKVFLSVVRSPHAHVKDIYVVLKKLMALSFEGMRKGRVLFTPDDLTNHGLTPELAKDIGILIPQSTGPYLKSKLIQDHGYYLYFKHQTEQECLAALHVLSMDFQDFSNFIAKEVYEVSFTIVRRLICGILLNSEVLEAAKQLIKITDCEKKKASLIESLTSALKRAESKEDLLELFIDLNEAKDGATELIRSCIKEVNFSQTPLSPSAVQAVASVMKQCDRLPLVNLWNTNLDERKLDILTKTLMKSNLKIDELKVGGVDFGDDGIVRLAKFAKHCQVKNLGILSSSLQWQRMKAFLEGVDDMKLEKLDVSGNHSLELEGVHYLGKVVKHYGVKDVCATWCNVKSPHVERFIKGLENAKVDYLDLEDMWANPVFGRPILELIPHVEKELNLTGWKVTEQQKLEMEKKLNEISSPSLTVILGEKRRNVVNLQATIQRRALDETTFSEIERRIKTNSVKSQTIGRGGGVIEQYALRLTFPPETFDADEEFRTIVSTDFSDCLEDRVRIAPVVGGFHRGELKKPVLMEVEHWLYPSGENASIEVYKKDDESSEWRFFKEVTIKNDERIVLTTPQFSWYEFVVKCASAGWSWISRPFLEVSLLNLIYVSRTHRSIVCIFCVKDDKVKDDVTRTLRENNYEALLPLPEQFKVRKDRDIDVTIQSLEPENLHLIPNRTAQGRMVPAKALDLSFPVKTVISECHAKHQVLLRGLDGVYFEVPNGVVIFNFSLKPEGIEKWSQQLQTEWPTPQSETALNVTENTVNFYGPVKGPIIVASGSSERL